MSTDFGQWRWNILYGYTVVSLVCSMVYKLLVKFEIYMFWSQGCRILEWKSLKDFQGFKKILIWYLTRFTQHKLGWFWTWWIVRYWCSFILYWWYIVLCFDIHSPRYRILDNAGNVKEIKDQVYVIPKKRSRVVWLIVDYQWAVDTFQQRLRADFSEGQRIIFVIYSITPIFWGGPSFMVEG